MISAPTYQNILQQFQSYEDSNYKLDDRGQAVSEIARNLADVKSHLMGRLSLLEVSSKETELQKKYGGSQITILVENCQYKVERLQTLISAHRKSTIIQRQNLKKVSDDNTFEDYSKIPFNTTSKRFLPSGTHPRFYDKANLKVNSELPTESSDSRKSSFTNTISTSNGWKSRKERDVVLKLSQMALKEKEEEVLKQRGPGKYNITETNLYLKGSRNGQKMGSSIRMAGDSPLAKPKYGPLHRSKLEKSMVNPGAGTYYIKEPEKPENAQISSFNYGKGHDLNLGLSSGLPPTQYRKESSIDVLLKKVCSVKGPYNIFSGARDKRINTGSCRHRRGLFHNRGYTSISSNQHYEKTKSQSSKPAAEEHKKNISSLLSNFANNRTGNTNKPNVSEEQIPANQQWRKCDHRKPRAASKKPSHISAKAAAKGMQWKENYGFLSSSKRVDKQMMRFDKLSPGPGRYNISYRPEQIRSNIKAKHL